ncbi:MAG: C-terminal helicase domain-containing protein, partial [Patescibacteria group bacterium]
PGTVAIKVQQEIIVLENDHKKTALLELLNQTQDAVLVFTRTKHGAKKLTQWLRGENQRAEELHGNLSLAQRKKAVNAVQTKKSRILVATDVAARGIDIAHLRLVINYDLPENAEDYVHRIGRTGRAGINGRAVSFVSTDQKNELGDIQHLINSTIKQTHLKTVPTAELTNARRKLPRRGGRSNSFNKRGNGYYSRSRSKPSNKPRRKYQRKRG